MARKKAAKKGPKRREIAIRGDRVRAARDAKGLNQSDVYGLTGIHPRAVSVIEQGHQGCTDTTLKKLCLALGVSADYLLGLIDTPRPLK